MRYGPWPRRGRLLRHLCFSSSFPRVPNLGGARPCQGGTHCVQWGGRWRPALTWPRRDYIALLEEKEKQVVSLDSVDKSEQAISEDTRCTLLMHNTRSASGGSHGVHHMLLSTPAMHALWPTRLRRASGPLWSRSWHPATAMHHVSGHVFGAPRHGILRCACGGTELHYRDAGP